MFDTPLTISIKSDATGHTVEWSKGDVSGRLGPYQSKETAERVLEAKRRELEENAKPA